MGICKIKDSSLVNPSNEKKRHNDIIVHIPVIPFEFTISIDTKKLQQKCQEGTKGFEDHLRQLYITKTQKHVIRLQEEANSLDLHTGRDQTSLSQRALVPRHMDHTRISKMNSSSSSFCSHLLLLLTMVSLIHVRGIQQLFFHHLTIHIASWFKDAKREEKEHTCITYLDMPPSSFQRNTKQKPHSSFSKCHRVARISNWTRK